MNVIMPDGAVSDRPVTKPKPKPMRIPAWSEVVMLKDRYVAYKGFADRLASRGNNVVAINRALVGALRAKRDMDKLYLRWSEGA